MEYQKAKDIRKKSFGELLADKLISGESIGQSFSKTLSERSKARMTGIKETFDPLNIAKALTGGSRLGPALLGKLTGRSQADLKYFAGDPKRKKISSLAATGLDSETLQSSTECLGRIYELLKQDRDNKVKQREKQQDFNNKIESQEELRNQELIKALTARRKKTPKEKRKEEVKQKESDRKIKKDNKKSETEQKQSQQKTETEKKKTETKSEGEKKQTAEKIKKEEIKQPAEKQKTETKQKKIEEAPKVEKSPEIKPPTKEPVTKPTEVKPPTAEKMPKPTPTKPPVISGGDKSVMDMVKKHEGVRTKPYKDSLGLWTVGVGHLIGDGKTLPEEWKNRELTMQEVDELFAKDFQKHKEMAMAGPGWNKANDVGQAALIDLTFNMGAWWKKFKNAAKALDAGDFNRAADELQYKDPATKEPSLWYQQVKGRAVTIVDMIRRGKSSGESVQIPNLAGEKIDSSSKTNKNLKEQQSKDKAPIIVNNNKTVTQGQSSSPKSTPVDDKPAYMKKVQGQ